MNEVNQLLRAKWKWGLLMGIFMLAGCQSCESKSNGKSISIGKDVANPNHSAPPPKKSGHPEKLEDHFVLRYQTGSTHGDRGTHEYIEIKSESNGVVASKGIALTYRSPLGNGRVNHDVPNLSSKLPVSVRDEIFSLLDQNDYWDMRERYINRDVRDGTYRRLMLTSGDYQKKVVVINDRQTSFEEIVSALKKKVAKTAGTNASQQSELPSDLRVTLKDGPEKDSGEYVTIEIEPVPEKKKFDAKYSLSRYMADPFGDGTQKMVPLHDTSQPLSHHDVRDLYHVILSYPNWESEKNQTSPIEPDVPVVRITVVYNTKTYNRIITDSNQATTDPLVGQIRRFFR